MEQALCDLGDRVKDLALLKQRVGPENLNMQQQLELEQRKIFGFIHEAAKGLEWMHDVPIIHRDIKPENILICMTRSGEIAKLGDFGISRIITNPFAESTLSGGKGTVSWMAPEALQAYKFEEKFNTTKAVDIFSLGMTSHFAISVGNHPFSRSDKHGIMITMNICDDQISPAVLGPPNYSADHLLQWMMTRAVDGRPNIQQVVQHPCFWDWKKVNNFICDVARCFDGKHDLPIQNDIDAVYKTRVHACVNWVDRLDSDVKNVLFYWKKDYNSHSESIMKLVELLRDKYMHYRDMMAKNTLPTNDAFTFQGSFDEMKYWTYFLSKFPELVIHLFCQIANRNESSLDTLKRKHFTGFNTVPDWVFLQP